MAATGAFSSTAAGHEPFFVMRSNGAVEVVEHGAAPPLFEGAWMGVPTDQPPAQGVLGRGDKLLLVSDGVVDGIGRNELRQLLQSLPPNAKTADVEAAIASRLSTEAPANTLDDATFLVLGR